jgi:uncharacterized protein YecA (UPF0149 family)
MHETNWYENNEMKRQQEYFRAPSEGSLEASMNARLEELKEKGHTLVRRVKIGRNAQCPCGSGKKFKKCCLTKL